MRPPLSKELWYGSSQESNSISDVPNLKFRQWNGHDRSLYYEPESFYTSISDLAGRENGGISILKGHKVSKIDADKQTAYLDDGRTISYDKCLIATGMLLLVIQSDRM
jgi:programmed cell death 8 (apoptosis-inducing factor)